MPLFVPYGALAQGFVPVSVCGTHLRFVILVLSIALELPLSTTLRTRAPPILHLPASTCGMRTIAPLTAC